MIQSKLPWLIVFAAAISNCIGTLLLKQSRLAATNSGLFATIVNYWFITALLFFCTGLLLSAKAFDLLPVSAVVPAMQGIGFISITLLSSWLFKESLTLNQLVAASFIFSGIIIMTRG